MIMRKKRSVETDQKRADRLEKIAHELREATAKEDDDLDAMVRRSIKQHGA